MSGELEGYWRLVDPVWDKIEIYSGSDIFLATYAAADTTGALLYAAHFAQSEICNGGLRQLIGNSTGVLAPEAVQGFDAIGMPETGAIVSAAMRKLGDDYPRERELRKAVLAEMDGEAFGEMDRRFFVLIETENGGFEAAADLFAAAILHQPEC